MDYESGPYSATIKEGDTHAEFCIDICNDTELDMDETFTISINESMLHTDIVVKEPISATVTILDDECKYFICTYIRTYIHAYTYILYIYIYIYIYVCTCVCVIFYCETLFNILYDVYVCMM